jgi:carboxyl-terminal processing protease
MKLRIKIASALLAFGLAVAIAPPSFAEPNVPEPPAARETDANITRLTARLLEESQFAHHPFDTAMAAALIDRYLDSLDVARSLFLQSDVDEFAKDAAPLAKSTRGVGDTGVARAIFGRYLERLEQQVTYVTHALQTATFDFTKRDAYAFDRAQMAHPRDLAAASDLWRQELRSEYLEEKLGGKGADQIVNLLTHRHTQELQTMKALRSDEVLEGYLDTLAHVYDPHSDYLGHEEMESFSISMNLSLVGIGATLETSDGFCKIRELVPGGPAARSGLLKPGDRIVAVAQGDQEPVDIMYLPLSRAVELIRGPKASTVTLTVIPAGAASGSLGKKVALVRDQIKLEDEEAKARIVDLPASQGAVLRVGVIDLPSFYSSMGDDRAPRRSASDDVARLLTKLKAEHVRGVVLDLRRNGGGSLDEAIKMTGLFIRQGPVVQTRDSEGHIEVGTDPDPAVAYDGPTVVLVSRFSASASEILTGALQDYERALVVGDSSTFGKGTVQDVLPLTRVMDEMGLAHAYDPGALKVTTNMFYRPSGTSTQLRGVASDIVIPSTTDFAQVSESAQKNALPWDAIPAARYGRLNRVRPYASVLRARSVQRVATDSEFALLGKEIAHIKKTLSIRSVSLNEAERRHERAQSAARKRALESDVRKVRATAPVAYEITLENASSAGLPAPPAFPSNANTASKAGGPPADAVSSEPDDLDDDGSGRTTADDIVLDEGERILADYVGLLGRKRGTSDLAVR